eukprot:TRINITY_DN112005_c0_g1_i1.p1 TRINITY_DN112005_c0_g1~~TRINITY_DN112005_c0_g1_i1.p1  ORF type:complete len:260 (-),score=72.11 TRINITY_DN112005_c0_g1_i1:73-852(-)
MQHLSKTSRPQPRVSIAGLTLAAAVAVATVSVCGRCLTAFVGQAPRSQATRGFASQLTRRAAENPFDPFGLTGAVKDALQGGGPEEAPSENDERMMREIFEKFDLDKDGVLNLDEFNKLQLTTEGDEAVYTQDQLSELLKVVNSNNKAPEKGMPYGDYRALYVDRRLRQAYGTDVVRDHLKVFGPGGGSASSASDSDALPPGMVVRVEGLTGAKELNGQMGQLVVANEGEAALASEGRVIVRLEDGERIALRPANIVKI